MLQDINEVRKITILMFTKLNIKVNWEYNKLRQTARTFDVYVVLSFEKKKKLGKAKVRTV